MNVKSFNERDLLQRHTPLVSSAVSQFTSSAQPICSADHLHGLALIALLDAARLYPATSHVPFETFARVQIHGALLGEVRRAKKWFSSAGAGSAETSTPALV
ncbi:MAG: sigma factor [Verrucomicrobiae bacterium]|nr:sigma factor [Verrucomicrobiae bacterium]